MNSTAETLDAMVKRSGKEMVLFDWTDYSVFFLMLLTSALIGVYFGCFGSKQKTTAEYLLGGKTMKAIPVGLSLVASHICGITLIGVPAEVYTDTATYWLVCLSMIFVLLVASYFFLPVYCGLNITSAYEYLEMRFSRSARTFASILYIIHGLIYLPMVIYVPSLALSQVTGVSLYLISVGVTSVCVFYTMIGGLKAVVWTDFLQTVVTIASLVAIVVIGTIDAGGLAHVMHVASEGGKLNIFNMDPNPFQRNTFWTVFVGCFFAGSAGTISNQGSIQRFMSVPNLREAKKVLIIYWIGTTFLTSISVYGGILVYASYYGCDPIEMKRVSRPDQIYPFFVLDKIGYIPALPGLFVAGVFSAALSSLSAVLNTLAGTVYEDYIKRKNTSEERANIILKSIVVIFGIFAVTMVFVVEKMGKIMAVGYTISSITGTPILALFVLGMLVPFANTKGAMTGACSAIAFLSWIAVGSSMSKVHTIHKPVYPGVPDTCEYHTEEAMVYNNITESVSEPEEKNEVFFMYRLSYMSLVAFGTILAVVVGMLVSYFTGKQDLNLLQPKLIAPPLRRFLPAKVLEEFRREESALITEMKILNSQNKDNC